jgi:hydrogenase maturation protein HypF
MQSSLTLVQGTKITVEGLVQGVGFRPFIQRMAALMGLKGRVWNSQHGVNIELIANNLEIEQFIQRLHQSAPKLARIDSIRLDVTYLPKNLAGFSIDNSDANSVASNIPPDQAMCEVCLSELFEPTQRHQHYAFNSCSDCGPRFSIIKGMPYDRHKTAMDGFTLCSDCQHEYRTMDDRRLHTEAISCPACGPHLQLLDNEGELIAESTEWVYATSAKWLSEGKLLAVKGIGGFHLCCSALNQQAIATLRKRKHRPTKPFAVMMQDIDQVKRFFTLSAIEMEQLSLPSAPIVLLPRHRAILMLPELIAPDASHIGVMLAYSPLHHLLLKVVAYPLLMTSGNRGGEPLCRDNEEAKQKLIGIADGWLVHNRQIVNRCDDSLIKIIYHKPRLLRRARGYVPTGIEFISDHQTRFSILAMGADLKNTFALTCDNTIILSGHNGDLNEPSCFTQTVNEIARFSQLFTVSPEAIVIDKHPDYFSSRVGRQFSAERNLPIIEVQHHHAHFASCLIENQIYPDHPILGIILDGMGYGDDGTFWGGELLLANFHSYQRLGGLKPYPLLGGDKANVQPWRNALALMHEMGFTSNRAVIELCDESVHRYDENQLELLLKNINMFPITSSAGRLFDAVAALLGVAPPHISYEGEAASKLEGLALQASRNGTNTSMPACLFDFIWHGQLLQLDPRSFLRVLLNHLTQGTDKAQLAAWFHQCFVDSWVVLVKKVSQQAKKQSLYPGHQIALSGGVFQNQLILEAMTKQLEAEGYTVYSHSQVPSNDGGIALGQSAIALKHLELMSCA